MTDVHISINSISYSKGQITTSRYMNYPWMMPFQTLKVQSHEKFWLLWQPVEKKLKIARYYQVCSNHGPWLI